MPQPQSLHQPAPNVFLWHTYDPAVKADLYSTTLVTSAGLLFIDPIPLNPAALDELLKHGRPAGVIVTNANHDRAATDYADRFTIPVMRRGQLPRKTATDLDFIAIDGAADNEMAVYHQANGGTLVLGDALINFQPHGFTFLPGKYCSDETKMRRSLRQLLDLKVDRIFFAHGEPILRQARERLAALLET